MWNTRRRREEILRIVRDSAVQSQEDLLALLGRRGFRVTQPTLSRDIHALGLAKTPVGWVLPGDIGSPAASPADFAPALQRAGKFEQAVREFVLWAEPSGQLVVARTPPAGAQPVARALDEVGLPGVVGTVAGDDTVFVATKGPEVATALVRRMRRVVGQTGRSPRSRVRTRHAGRVRGAG